MLVGDHYAQRMKVPVSVGGRTISAASGVSTSGPRTWYKLRLTPDHVYYVNRKAASC